MAVLLHFDHRSGMFLRLFVFLALLIGPAFASWAQSESSLKLNELGEALVRGLKANEEDMLLEHFFTKQEVGSIMAAVNRTNGGEGVLGYELDSIYDVFQEEIRVYYNEVRAKANLEDIKWRKMKFEEIGLNNPTVIDSLATADLILVMRYRKSYYMVRFPQCFQLDDGWKIGAVIEWIGRVSK